MRGKAGKDPCYIHDIEWKREVLNNVQPVSEAHSQRAGGPTRSDAGLEQGGLSSIRLRYLEVSWLPYENYQGAVGG